MSHQSKFFEDPYFTRIAKRAMKFGARCGVVDICCTFDLAHRDYTDIERGVKSQISLMSNQIKVTGLGSS